MLRTARLLPPSGLAALTTAFVELTGALPTLKIVRFDVPEPGMKAETVARPAVTISASAMAAETCVASMKVVGRGVPFQRSTVLEVKFDPVAVSVNPAPPEFTAPGESDEIAGCPEGPLSGIRISHTL